MTEGFVSAEGKMIYKLASLLKQHDDKKHRSFIHYYKIVEKPLRDDDGKIVKDDDGNIVIAERKNVLYNIEEVVGYGFCRLYNSTTSYDSLRWREKNEIGKVIPLPNPRRYECADLSPEGIMKELMLIHKRKSLYCACSGGKDSISLAHYTYVNYRKYFKGIFYVVTGVGMKMVLDWLEGYAKGWDWKLFLVKNKKGDVYKERVMINGFPIESNHPVIMRRLKYIPMYDFAIKLANQSKNVLMMYGTRKFESARRMGNVPPILSHGRMWSCSPFYTKTNDEVYKYLAEHDLKISPTYEMFGKSGDCFCGSYTSREEMDLLKKYEPELAEYFLQLERDIAEYGTDRAKKYGKWANMLKGTTSDNVMKESGVDKMICGGDDGCGEGTMHGLEDF